MSKTVFAYLVIDTLVEPIDPILEIPAGYKPPIERGEIMLQLENLGGGTVTLTQEDGPAKIVLTGQYLGEGESAGEQVIFTLGMQRLLNLLSIGIRNEQVLKDQIHEFADKAKELVEEHYHPGNANTLGDQLRAIDNLEKHFFDRKNR